MLPTKVAKVPKFCRLVLSESGESAVDSETIVKTRALDF